MTERSKETCCDAYLQRLCKIHREAVHLFEGTPENKSAKDFLDSIFRRLSNLRKLTADFFSFSRVSVFVHPSCHTRERIGTLRNYDDDDDAKDNTLNTNVQLFKRSLT